MEFNQDKPYHFGLPISNQQPLNSFNQYKNDPSSIYNPYLNNEFYNDYAQESQNIEPKSEFKNIYQPSDSFSNSSDSDSKRKSIKIKNENPKGKKSSPIDAHPNILPAHPNILLAHPNIPPAYPNILPAHPNIPLAHPNIPPAHPNIPPAHPNILPAHPNIPLAHPNIPPAHPNILPAHPNIPPAHPNILPAHPNIPLAHPNILPAHPNIPPAHPNIPPAHPNIPPAHLNIPPAHPNIPPAHPNIPPVHLNIPPAHPNILPAHPNIPPAYPNIPLAYNHFSSSVKNELGLPLPYYTPTNNDAYKHNEKLKNLEKIYQQNDVEITPRTPRKSVFISIDSQSTNFNPNKGIENLDETNIDIKSVNHNEDMNDERKNKVIEEKKKEKHKTNEFIRDNQNNERKNKVNEEEKKEKHRTNEFIWDYQNEERINERIYNLNVEKKENNIIEDNFIEDNEKVLEGFLRKYNKYANGFLYNFDNSIITQTFCEKLSCRKKSNLFRLKKLKIESFDVNRSERLFLESKEFGGSKFAKISMIDFYLACSLIEIDELNGYFNKELFFDYVKKVTDESIIILTNNKFDDQKIPSVYFEKTRKFLGYYVLESEYNFEESQKKKLLELLTS